ncbi:hypothetical protein A3I57_01835 [Candidatus Beckwithbacteria bacterium RIFCSPLOWO2_02_FULL_47_23]|uniref:Uncharacterized protein n=1 Tax=Candidatus Beckwithbacteria bacterium RIFCSPLOWO2_02_FULL_47_23 TaxID=1797463 RepID=A0A1F5DQW3_9BACT|nr:MAG: hypothetical protein A3I57_01835 [Candidatus Beckwithbacteria bacterium RIFCSPLOWO2_02_FULL_47_23]
MKKMNTKLNFPIISVAGSNFCLFSPHPLNQLAQKYSFLTAKRLFLTVIYSQKHYQIKPKSKFNQSGSHIVKLLNSRAKRTRQIPVGSPQIAAVPNRFYRSDYIISTGFSPISLFLKKPLKLIKQTGSNPITIAAIYAN